MIQGGALVEGTWGAEFLPAMAPDEGEVVIVNRGVSAFNGTTLEPAQRANLDLAIDMVVPFRRALALAVLDAVAHAMT